jgi:hypothetical protein
MLALDTPKSAAESLLEEGFRYQVSGVENYNLSGKDSQASRASLKERNKEIIAMVGEGEGGQDGLGGEEK